MAIAFKKENFAKSTLSAGITLGAVSVTLQSGAGALFPSSGNFRAVFWDSAYTSPQDDTTREIVTATISADDTFTITRAQESTAAKAWSINDNFALTITKGVIDEIETEISSHTHDDRYYTETKLDAGQLDNRYYTETELDAGQLDNRYYTETELDALIAYRGALVTITSAPSIADITWTSIEWDSEITDTDTIHDNSTNPERFTVPSGVTKVRLTANISFNTNSTGVRGTRIQKNGDVFYGMPILSSPAISGGPTRLNMVSPILTVSSGDYFTVDVWHSAGAPLALFATLEEHWFSMEIIA